MAEFYLGLMSGTSMDAVDAALVDFSSLPPRLLATHSIPMPDHLREALLRLAAEHTPHPLQCLGELDHHLGCLFARAVNELLAQAGVAADAVQAIGSHGQTLYHQPHGMVPFTLQLADPNIIAERTDITTVADFRRRDMAAGGQGAPLVPAFHAAMLRQPGVDRVILNIGGMANITLLPAAADTPVSGFDTGPGNALLDGWAERHLGTRYDTDGEWGAAGQVLPGLLQALLAEPYFRQAPPKSTGRELFNLAWLERHLRGGENTADVQATLAELTAVSAAMAILSHSPETMEVLVCGGGARNGHLMARLRAHLPHCRVSDTRQYGLDPQWVEAMAFAWLARQSLLGRPGNLPAVTGATRPVVLGAIYPGQRWSMGR